MSSFVMNASIVMPIYVIISYMSIIFYLFVNNVLYV